VADLGKGKGSGGKGLYGYAPGKARVGVKTRRDVDAEPWAGKIVHRFYDGFEKAPYLGFETGAEDSVHDKVSVDDPGFYFVKTL